MPEDLPADIELKADRYGWTAAVPSARGTFLGHPITLEIHTSTRPCVSQPPLPDKAETALAADITANLPNILRDAEVEFTTYNAKLEPNASEHIRHPHIWVCREFIESGTAWAFVIERDDAPDFGYHVEFRGSQCLGISAGD